LRNAGNQPKNASDRCAEWIELFGFDDGRMDASIRDEACRF
jgi:hypothetical protein